jgi:MFS family permease
VIVQVIPNTYPVLVVGRLIAGFGCGAIYIAQVSYVTECAPASLRGSIVGTTGSFGYQLGAVLAFWTGFGMSFVQSPVNVTWRVSNILQIPIGFLAITMSFWYPESPRFLLEKYNDNPGLCLAALAKLRSGTPEDDHVRTEFHELVTSLAARSEYESGFVGLFKDRSMRKRLAFGIYATSLQTLGGIATINIYAARIYESLGWTKGHQALGLNGCLGIFQLLSVLISTFTVDRFGRRRLLLLGFGIQTLALLICASLTTSFPENDNRLAAIFEVMMLFIVGLSYYVSEVSELHFTFADTSPIRPF